MMVFNTSTLYFHKKNKKKKKKLFKEKTNPRVKFHTSLIVIPFEKVYSPY